MGKGKRVKSYRNHPDAHVEEVKGTGSVQIAPLTTGDVGFKLDDGRGQVHVWEFPVDVAEHIGNRFLASVRELRKESTEAGPRRAVENQRADEGGSEGATTASGWDLLRQMGCSSMASTFEAGPDEIPKVVMWILSLAVKRGVREFTYRCVPFRRWLTGVTTRAIAGWMYRWADAAVIGDYGRIDHCWKQIRDLSDALWEHGWLDWPEVEKRMWASDPTVTGVSKIELELSYRDPLAGPMKIREKPVLAGIWLEEGAGKETKLSMAVFDKQRWANILAGGEPMPHSWLQREDGKRIAILAGIVG